MSFVFERDSVVLVICKLVLTTISASSLFRCSSSWQEEVSSSGCRWQLFAKTLAGHILEVTCSSSGTLADVKRRLVELAPASQMWSASDITLMFMPSDNADSSSTGQHLQEDLKADDHDQSQSSTLRLCGLSDDSATLQACGLRDGDTLLLLINESSVCLR